MREGGMKCPRCQHENPSRAKFCLECGARLARGCSQCGTELPVGAKFCLECGQAVGGPTGAQDRFSSPESYTPKHLAEKILTSKSALEGERKQVTVLFADLKGSMELLADRDPEEARKILDPVLERMMEAVHRYEGTVNQVMGDGIMALFGAPLAHEDHAVRACYAALRMQESVRKYAEDVRRSHAVVVKIRVGLNSGEVVVRAIGSDLHMDYTAVGQTTHLAARMEQLADPGAIVVTPETLALAEGYVEVKPLGPVPVKGLPDSLEVYEVTGAGPARTRLQASAWRGLTRFVGRDAEVEQLRRAQHLAGAGHGQVVAVVGEAGVGKSRLFYEFTHSHRVHGWLVLQSSSVSYGKATGYLPVIDLLKGYLKIQDRDELREIREKVTGKLLTLDRALEPTLPALLALLDVPVEDPAWQALDPGQRRLRTLDAIRRLLLREAREQPLLLIFEDLHWIDSETHALLDGLVESLGSVRLLLLVNYRPEFQHAWGSKTSYSQLRLDALPAESAGELLEALLGSDPGVAPLKQLLVKRGNPFFLEETVRTLVETKALVGEPGRYWLTQPVQAIRVPATVHAMLAARIDRLPPDERRLLQTASVIGKDVPFALIQAIADLPDEGLRRGLDHLQTAEFLYEAAFYPDLEYTFKHALTHEVAYGTLLQERRRSLHTRIVATIEALYPDRLTEHVERLAHHAYRGEDWTKAVAYLQQAGSKAAARSAHQEAVTWFDQALVALGHLPESRSRNEQAIDLRFDLRRVLLPLGEHDRTFNLLHKAESLAQALGDHNRLGQVLVYLTEQFRLMSNFERALESGQRALALATAHGDVGLQVMANFYMGTVSYDLGDYRRATDFFRWNVASLEGSLTRERFGMTGLPSVLSRVYLSWSLAELGAFAEASTKGGEGVRIAEAADQPFSLIWAYVGIGHLHLCKGDFQPSIPSLESALRLCHDWHIPILFPMAASTLGVAFARSGRLPEGLALLEQAVLQRGRHAVRLVRLSEAYLLARRTEDAFEHAQRALDFSTEHKYVGYQAYALQLLGDISAQRDPPEVTSADEHYRNALALSESLGMRPLVAHCHLGLSKLSRRTSQHDQAQEHLTIATTMYREMGMKYWLEKAADLKD
jgi:class 3 adenylate cyclase/tetratricopeptide (TPR) repeat protein